MTYHSFTTNKIENFIPEIARITQKSNLFEPDIIICQNRYLKEFIQLEVAKYNGYLNAINFIDQNKIKELIASDAFNLKHKEHLFPDKLVFQILIFNLLSSKQTKNKQLSKYLSESESSHPDRQKALSLSFKLAALFDSYHKTRLKMIKSWQQNRSFINENKNLAMFEKWQMDLWNEIFLSDKLISYLSLINEVKQLHTANRKKKIIIAGSAFLLEIHLDFLHELSKHTDVFHFLFMPTQTYFGDFISPKDQLKNFSGNDSNHNSLINNWGKLGRDLQNKMLNFPSIIENQQFNHSNKKNLLSEIQTHLLDCKNTKKLKTKIVTDESFQVFSAPSKLREVEVLFDHILKLLDSDNDYKLSDILVASPDINQYKTMIESVFSRKIETSQGSKILKIPMTFYDIITCQESAFMDGIFKLFEIIKSDFKVESVINFLRNPLLMNRYNITYQDIDLFQKITAELHINSGINSSKKITSVQGLWNDALKRIVLSYITDSKDIVCNLLPFKLTNDSDYDVLFKMIDICSSLFNDLKKMQKSSNNLNCWADLCQKIIKKHFLIREAESDDQLHYDMISNILTDFRVKTTKLVTAKNLLLKYNEFFSFFEEKIRNLSQTQVMYNKHGLTCGSIRSFRISNFKTVFLIGMNEESFPAKENHLSFDLKSANQQLMDASQRDVDKYCFLEILSSVQEKMICSYISKDKTQNAPLNPCVLIEELLTYIENNFYHSKDQSIRSKIITHHPNEGFNHVYFQSKNNFFSYNSLNYQIISNTDTFRKKPNNQKNINKPAIENTQQILHQKELTGFLKNPVKYYFQNSLKINLSEQKQKAENYFFEIDQLTLWQFYNHIFTNYLNKKNELIIKEIDKFILTLELSGTIFKGIFSNNLKNKLTDRILTTKSNCQHLNFSKHKIYFLNLHSNQKKYISQSIFKDKKTKIIDPLHISTDQKIKTFIYGEITNYFETEFISFAQNKIQNKHFLESYINYLILRSLNIIDEQKQKIRSIIISFNEMKTREKEFNLTREEAINKLHLIIKTFLDAKQSIFPCHISVCETVLKHETKPDLQDIILEKLKLSNSFCPYTKEALKYDQLKLNPEKILLFAKEIYQNILIG